MIAEDWKYSNLKRIYGFLAETVSKVRPESNQYSNALSFFKSYNDLIFFDGFGVNRELSTIKNVEIKEGQFKSPIEASPLLDFNSKNAGKSFLIDLKRSLNQPLLLVYGFGSAGGAHQIEIVASGKNQIIELFLGEISSGVASVRVDLKVLANAEVKHFLLANLGSTSKLNHFLNISQDENSKTEFFNLSSGGQWMRFDLRNQLCQKHASTVLAGLYLKAGSEIVDHCTKVIHQAPNTFSEQIYKGVLGGNAKAIFNGLIKISENCDESRTTQLNRNLIVGSGAEAIGRPQLEILNDNVKANHGMTIGNLNPAELFYLQSRGIPVAQAHDLLADAFINELTDRFLTQELKPFVDQAVKAAWEHLRKEVT